MTSRHSKLSKLHSGHEAMQGAYGEALDITRKDSMASMPGQQVHSAQKTPQKVTLTEADEMQHRTASMAKKQTSDVSEIAQMQEGNFFAPSASLALEPELSTGIGPATRKTPKLRKTRNHGNGKPGRSSHHKKLRINKKTAPFPLDLRKNVQTMDDNVQMTNINSGQEVTQYSQLKDHYDSRLNVEVTNGNAELKSADVSDANVASSLNVSDESDC